MHVFGFSSRRLIVPAVVALAALAPVALTATAAARTGKRMAVAAGTPRCRTSDLVIWLATNGNGTAGSTFYDLELTNLSGRSCTLRGYPGVSAVNLAGRQVGSAATRDNRHRTRTISIRNGKTATAVLRIVDVGVFGTGCNPVTAAGLRVFPPNATASKVIPFPFGACSRAGKTFLSVQVVS